MSNNQTNNYPEKLKSLLDEERFDEAKDLVHEIVKKPLSDEEVGRQTLNTLMVYMEYMTDINNEYADQLDKVSDFLEGLQAKEEQLDGGQDNKK